MSSFWNRMTGRDSVRHSTNNESITKSVKESSEQSDNDHDNNKDNAEQTRQQDQQQYDEDDSNSNPINPDPLPRGPPPPPTTTNYLLETKGSPSPTLAADLARKRPLDPVFRQAEASFPKLLGTTGDPIGTTSTPSTLLSNNNVSIFVPTLNSSRKEEDDENDDDDEMPSENDTANDNPEQMPEEPINDEKSIQEEEEEEDATAYIQDSIAVEEEVVLETIDNEHEHQRLQEKEELIEDDHEHDDETSKDPQQQQQQEEEDQVEYEEKGETSIITQPSKATKATKPSRFVFLSDQNTVPSDLKRLQEKTRQRRRELKNQFYDLEYRLGLSASKYAEEKMDLGLAIRDTFDRTVCRPLEASMERIVMEQETDMHSKPAIRQLEQRLERLDKLMMRHVHVSMNDAKREELDMLHQDLRREIIPGIRVEKSKADKLERGVISRYELNAGAVTKRFHHESAARRAQIEVVGQRLKQTIDDHEMRSSNVLEVIASLREQIKREREERRQADQKIMEEIDKTSVAMKRAFLAAIDDSK